jgi:hypothetical protein
MILLLKVLVVGAGDDLPVGAIEASDQDAKTRRPWQVAEGSWRIVVGDLRTAWARPLSSQVTGIQFKNLMQLAA